MSFMDRAKAAAEQVRARAQEGVEEVQTRKELAQAYWDLGHKTYELASSGGVSHPEIDPLVERITELLDRVESDGGGTGSGQPEQAAAPAQPETPSEPPAAPETPGSPAQPEQVTDTTPPEAPA